MKTGTQHPFWTTHSGHLIKTERNFALTKKLNTTVKF